MAHTFSETEERLPPLFIGHGSPMNAVDDNEFSRARTKICASLRRPRAVLCVSAHWETDGTRVTVAERPKTVHDFYGFPPELYARRYPAPGSPALARLVEETAEGVGIEPDASRDLDHGAWAVLSRLFPDADVPVVQPSLDRTKPPEHRLNLGRSLRPLRNRGVIILGSGNVVHNLSALRWGGENRCRACDRRSASTDS